MSRRNARENAFKMIFVMEADKERENIPEEFFADTADGEFWSGKDASGEEKTYIMTAYNGVAEKKDELDAIVEKYLKNWQISRINKVCLAALRLAVYEMLYMESIPIKVSASEIVEIVKKYAGDEESKFVNGVLGEYIRQERS